MALTKFGLMLGAALIGLPLAVANAGPHDSISSDGSEAGSVGPVGRMSPSYQGTSKGSEALGVEDALASGKGGVMSAEGMALLEIAKPMIGPGSGESVIGPDGRRRIGTTTKFPYRAIAMILFNGGYLCTGWFISPNTVATAGHCVYDPGVGFYPTGSYTIYPGANGSATPYGSCNATRLSTVKGWANSGRDDYDYGAIKLDCTVGNTVGWFGFFWTRGTLNNLPAFITGYPGDKSLGTMWRSKGRIKVTQPRRVFYPNDTAGGMSGSPVYYKRRSCGWCSMAVHAYGTGGGYPYNSYNHGTRINKAVFKNLKKWKN